MSGRSLRRQAMPWERRSAHGTEHGERIEDDARQRRRAYSVFASLEGSDNPASEPGMHHKRAQRKHRFAPVSHD